MTAHTPMDQIRKLVAEQMRETPLGNVDNPTYWYPLAVASYGVDEVMQAIEAMTNYRTSMWRRTAQFEDLFGELFGGEAIMVNSGSSADLLMVFANLRDSGGTLQQGDEVLVPAVTWPTHLWAVLMAGLKPVLVDVDPMNLNMCVDDLTKKISEQTSAVFPVHLMGNPAPMGPILDLAQQNGAIVMEDSCEALGAKWNGNHTGSIGQAGSFSFFFSHHITTMEGGMILTQDRELAERIRLLRAHGWSRNVRDQNTLHLQRSDVEGLDPRYTFVEWGFNVRPTELQAGFGLEQLGKLPAFEANRKANVNFFSSLLVENQLDEFLALPIVERESEPSWFALPMVVQPSSPKTRNEITDFLDKYGVETRPIVAGNLAKHPVRRRFPGIFDVSLPGAEAVHERGFYVGLYPYPMEDMLTRLIELLSRLFGDPA